MRKLLTALFLSMFLVGVIGIAGCSESAPPPEEDTALNPELSDNPPMPE